MRERERASYPLIKWYILIDIEYSSINIHQISQMGYNGPPLIPLSGSRENPGKIHVDPMFWQGLNLDLHM